MKLGNLRMYYIYNNYEHLYGWVCVWVCVCVCEWVCVWVCVCVSVWVCAYAFVLVYIAEGVHGLSVYALYSQSGEVKN